MFKVVAQALWGVETQVACYTGVAQDKAEVSDDIKWCVFTRKILGPVLQDCCTSVS